jgi:hypothetical protein
MTFSIRSFLIVIAILACWLGALVSKSPLMIELVANTTALLILLTLAFAIWDRRPEQRAFWTGCFVLGFGSLMLTHYSSGYQRTSYRIASLILGDPTAQTTTPFPNYGPNAPMPAPSVSFYQPPNGPGPFTTTYAIQIPANPNQDYYQQQEAIRAAVPTLFSLLVAGIGGWMTLWISRRSKDAGNEQASHS